eukprot:g3383.t1
MLALVALGFFAYPHLKCTRHGGSKQQKMVDGALRGGHRRAAAVADSPAAVAERAVLAAVASGAGGTDSGGADSGGADSAGAGAGSVGTAGVAEGVRTAEGVEWRLASCREMYCGTGMVLGVTWGSLPVQKRMQWEALRCHNFGLAALSCAGEATAGGEGAGGGGIGGVWGGPWGGPSSGAGGGNGGGGARAAAAARMGAPALVLGTAPDGAGAHADEDASQLIAEAHSADADIRLRAQYLLSKRRADAARAAAESAAAAARWRLSPAQRRDAQAAYALRRPRRLQPPEGRPGGYGHGADAGAEADANPVADVSVSPEQQERANAAAVAAWCGRVKKSYGVHVGTNWGAAGVEIRGQWQRLGCNELDPGYRATRAKERVYLLAYGATIDAAVAARAPREVVRKQRGSGEVRGARAGHGVRPIVAVCVASTSRGKAEPSFLTLPLFAVLLKSFIRRLELGFEYWLYLAFDAGDTFFDSQAVRDRVDAWVRVHVARFAALRGVVVRWATLRFDNPLAKPGPVFNFVTKAAWTDGADFIYRVNDDTELASAWTRQAVDTLYALDPPLLGVVGPLCDQGKRTILTHDMVHRQHLEIFSTYYPPALLDWWMDDWISHVYGPARTRKGPFRVVHHLRHSGTRYDVDFEHKHALRSSLRAGDARLRAWAQRNVKCKEASPLSWAQAAATGHPKCERTTPILY